MCDMKEKINDCGTLARCLYVNQKNKKLTKKLKEKLLKIKRRKVVKVFTEKELSPKNEVNTFWVEPLKLTVNDKQNILTNKELDDFVIYTSLKLIQRQFPMIVIQSPSVCTAAGYDYCSHETIQIAHNGEHHWVLLSSLKGEINIFDSLNTNTTLSLINQIKALFSPNASVPKFDQIYCHRQHGMTDCGLFAIAYAIDILSGIKPNEIIYDQSKFRKHLIRCLENGIMKQFPKFHRSAPRCRVTNSSQLTITTCF